MSDPEGIPTVTLVGRYINPDAAGTPLQGTIDFTPSPSVITFPDQHVIVSGTETAAVDGTGAFSITLIATDTADQNPTGWTYTVNEKLLGQKPRTYQIFLPYTVATVDISTITPTITAPTYLPVTGPQGPPGVITTLNGHSASTVNLTSADVGAVALTTLGAASGTATLDSSSHLTVSQLNLASSAPPSVGTGAVGTSSSPARADHTHDGVDLVNAQTVAGVKTFSSIPVLPASDPTTANQAARKSYVDTQLSTSIGTAVLLTGAQTVAGVKTFSSSPSVPTPSLTGDAASKGYTDGAQTFTAAKTFTNASSAAIAGQFFGTGDTNNRFQVQINGTLSWGSGSGAVDVSMSRAGAGILNITGTNQSTVTGTGSLSETILVSGDTNNRYQVGGDGKTSWGPGNAAVDTNLYRSASGVLMTDSQFQTNNTSILITRSTSTSPGYRVAVSGDTVERLNIRSDGQLGWGAGGSSAADTFLSRLSAGVLQLTSNTRLVEMLNSGATTTTAHSVALSGESVDRLQIRGDGRISWSAGTSIDTNLYRSAAGMLTTDTSLTVAGSLTVSTNATVTGTLGVTGVFLGASNVNTSTATVYTPTWTASTTNPTLGSSILAAKYIRIGKQCTYWGTLSGGSGISGGSGTWTMSLPFTAATWASSTILGSCMFTQIGANNYVGVSYIQSAGTTLGFIVNTTAGSGVSGNVSNTTPVATTSNSNLSWAITYETV